MSLKACASGKPPQNTSTFSITNNGNLKVGTGVCIGVGDAPGIQLWSKPMAEGKVAFLVLNPLSIPQKLAMPLGDVPGSCGSSGAEVGAGCALRDVWAGTDAPADGALDVALAPHESRVYILSTK